MEMESKRKIWLNFPKLQSKVFNQHYYWQLRQSNYESRLKILSINTEISYNFALTDIHFAYPLTMPSAFKRRGKELPNSCYRYLGFDETSRQAQYIGVVMLAQEGCHLFQPRDARSDVWVLIGGHTNAIRTATNQDTKRFGVLG
jgi:hypothetical protein